MFIIDELTNGKMWYHEKIIITSNHFILCQDINGTKKYQLLERAKKKKKKTNTIIAHKKEEQWGLPNHPLCPISPIPFNKRDY